MLTGLIHLECCNCDCYPTVMKSSCLHCKNSPYYTEILHTYSAGNEYATTGRRPDMIEHQYSVDEGFKLCNEQSCRWPIRRHKCRDTVITPPTHTFMVGMVSWMASAMKTGVVHRLPITFYSLCDSPKLSPEHSTLSALSNKGRMDYSVCTSTEPTPFHIIKVPTGPLCFASWTNHLVYGNFIPST